MSDAPAGATTSLSRVTRWRPLSGPWGLGSLRGRILLAFMVVISTFMLGQLWQVGQMQQQSEAIERVGGGYLPLSRQVARLREDQERVSRQLAGLWSGRQVDPVVEILDDELLEELAVAEVLINGLRQPDLPPEELATLAQLERYLEQVRAQLKRADALARGWSGLDDEALGGARRELQAVERQIVDDFDQLDKALARRITSLTVSAQQRQRRAVAGTVALTLAVGLVGGLMLLMVLHALSPIGRLTEQVQALARGERGGKVDVRGTHELAMFAREFEAMAQAIESRDRSLSERAELLDRLSRYLQGVMDALDDALVVLEDDEVTLANPAARERFGAQPGEPLRAPLQAEPGTVEQGGRQYSVTSVPFGDDGVIVQAADVTPLVRAQRAAARSERLALVGQMLSQITHEVRNPLNAMSLNAELLADELEAFDPERSSEAWEILQTISHQIDRLNGVTEHYLELTRRPTPDLHAVSLRALVEEARRLVAPEFGEAEVGLHIAVPDVQVMVDAAQIHQGLLNLLRNARESGTPTVWVQGHVDDGQVHLSVRDEGEGMAPEQVERALEPFFSTKAKGTGLGLAITRQILDDHDGRLDLRSTPGEGTTVTMVLWMAGEGAT